MTDDTPEFMRGAQEGEIRVRLQCDLCGCTIEGMAFIDNQAVRDQLTAVIRDHPDEALDAVRHACMIANGWFPAPLPDGGTVDVCHECLHTNPFIHEPYDRDPD